MITLGGLREKRRGEDRGGEKRSGEERSGAERGEDKRGEGRSDGRGGEAEGLSQENKFGHISEEVGHSEDWKGGKRKAQEGLWCSEGAGGTCEGNHRSRRISNSRQSVSLTPSGRLSGGGTRVGNQQRIGARMNASVRSGEMSDSPLHPSLSTSPAFVPSSPPTDKFHGSQT